MTAALNLNELARMSAESMLNCMLAGIAIGLFAWILLRVVGRRNSSTRFAVWFSALLAIAALPALGGMASSAGSAGSAITVPSSWALAIFFVWAVIAGVALARVGVGLLQLRKLRASCSAIDATALDPVLRATLHGFQGVRSVELCQSDRLQVPTAIGFLKPVVVIPAWAMQELSTPELNSILIHELAHLRRRDDWTNLAQQVLKALLFFHPAVWWIESQLALEREMACDDAVLAETANPRGYAQCLISMAEKSFLRRGLALAQAVVNRVHQTSLRVSRILDVNRSSATRVWKPALYSVAAFSVVCLVSLSHAPELVAFEDKAPNVVASVAAPVGVPISAADSNSLPKDVVATTASLRAKSAGPVDPPGQAPETLLQTHRIREGTSSLVPQSAENKSGLQPLRERISEQASFSAAAKAILARRTSPTQSPARLLEARFVRQDMGKFAPARSATTIDYRIAPQAILVVMHSAQYDEAGPMFWSICVWRATVLNSNLTSLETTTYLMNGFGKGTASQAAEKVSIRIRVCLQAYRKLQKISPALAAEAALYWQAMSFSATSSAVPFRASLETTTYLMNGFGKGPASAVPLPASLETTTYLMNGFGKGTASAVPLQANKNAGFSPWGTRQFPSSVDETASRIPAKQI